LNTDKVRIIRQDASRGEYVASVTNDMNGGVQTIIADYDIPDTQAWVVDPSGLAISSVITSRI